MKWCPRSRASPYFQTVSDRQVQCEAGAAARPVAFPGYLAAQFLGQDGAGMQAESMPLLLGRKSKFEQSAQCGTVDSRARVLDVYGEPSRRRRQYAHGQLPLAHALIQQRMARVAQEIGQDLDQLVTIERERQNRGVLAVDHDIGAGGKIERNGMVDQLGDIDALGDAAPARIALLCGDDLGDVLDMRD